MTFHRKCLLTSLCAHSSVAHSAPLSLGDRVVGRLCVCVCVAFALPQVFAFLFRLQYHTSNPLLSPDSSRRRMRSVLTRSLGLGSKGERSSLHNQRSLV